MIGRNRADVWTELPFLFVEACAQGAGEQLENHHGATPGIAWGAG